MIQNTRFLFSILLPVIFILSACSKEEKLTPELGKWTLSEQLIEDNNGDLKWISVDEDFQQIEFLHDGEFNFDTHSIFNCLVGVNLSDNSYSHEKNTITIENPDCGTNIFSYYIQDELLFIASTEEDIYKEKYVKSL